MKNFILVTSLILALAVSSSAQFVEDATKADLSRNKSLGITPAVTPFSLIDLSRVKWSNSYSVTFFSGGSSSGSVGLWNSRLAYDLSNSLSVAFDVNMLHNPGGLTGNGSNDATFLPGFSLDFHPSENFRMRFDYRTLDYRNDYYFWRDNRYR